jgi:hypothetical protein
VPPLHEQVRGRDHPAVGRSNHRRVITDAHDDLGATGRQQSPNRGDETELAQVSDGDGEPPASLRACRPGRALLTEGPGRAKSSGPPLGT